MIRKMINDELMLCYKNPNYFPKELLKYLLGFKNDGTPNITDGELLYNCLKVSESLENNLLKNWVYERIYKGKEKRYLELIQPLMISIPSNEFVMGSDEDNSLLYLGETPKHLVKLSNFSILKIPVTNYIYKKYNPNYHYEAGRDNYPVSGITWYDAYMFAMWVNCRLPTEAEWEYASGKNNCYEWCCEEKELDKYAWYSENSDGKVHPVGSLMPNKFGIYDMHGNTWEWVLDSYDSDYYRHSSTCNPLNDSVNHNKSCRGGSIHGFSDMCRCSFRLYQQADYFAYDLSFRIVKESEEE